MITRTGADPFGAFLHDALRRFGVDDRYVTEVPGLPTPVTFCEIFPPDDFPLYFYRQPKAPDLEIRGRRARPRGDPGGARLLGDGHRPVAGAEPLGDAGRARGARHSTGDHGARPRLPADVLVLARGGRAASIQQALAHVTVAVGNLRRVRHRGRRARATAAAARALRRRGVDLAVVKQGPKGVLADDGETVVEVPPVPVEVVNGLGAGDAFGGALCHGLLAGWELERVMRFCNAAGALVAGRLACADAMPAEDEVDAMLAKAAA